jgi:UDP-2,4-diacetamido-2,4,6-trideoxy-beta-L-altropyranose hydrolase
MDVALVIRADADTRMGTGHVMRCLALAQQWRRSGKVTFVATACPPALADRLQAENFELRRLSVPGGSHADAEATAAIANATHTAWLAVDGYQFGVDYIRALQAAGCHVLQLDDYGHAAEYPSEFVLNQNLSADARLYAHRSPQTQLLLGPSFALLREEFATWRLRPRDVSVIANKILVTLGGSDPDNVTATVIEGLRLVAAEREIEVAVIVGGGNPHRTTLEALVAEAGPSIRLIVNPPSMPELMARADVAVAAGGSTSWELAFFGLPSVILVIAPNQAPTAAALHEHGIAVSLGSSETATAAQIADVVRSLLDDPSRRDQMSRAGRELVDGLGARRITARLKACDIKLRPATDDDCRTLWHWANHPDVRAASFSSDPIPWETHERWFAARREAQRAIYLASTNVNKPLGQIRFEQTDAAAVISVSLAQEARGRDWGAALIVAGVERFLTESATAQIDAYIKPDNHASIRAFETAAFHDAGDATVRNQPARHFLLRRNEP